MRDLTSREFHDALALAEQLGGETHPDDRSLLVSLGERLDAYENVEVSRSIFAKQLTSLCLVLIDPAAPVECRQLARSGIRFFIEKIFAAEESGVECLWVCREMIRRISSEGIQPELRLGAALTRQIVEKATGSQSKPVQELEEWIKSRRAEVDKVAAVADFFVLKSLYAQVQGELTSGIDLANRAIAYLSDGRRILPCSFGPVSLLEDKCVLLSVLKKNAQLTEKIDERLRRVESEWLSSSILILSDGNRMFALPPSVALELSNLPVGLPARVTATDIALVSPVSTVPMLLIACVFTVERARDEAIGFWIA